jgi:hypothetical protein
MNVATRNFRGAHAARVHVSAASPKHLSAYRVDELARQRFVIAEETKVRDREDAIASTRGACAPQRKRARRPQGDGYRTIAADDDG